MFKKKIIHGVQIIVKVKDQLLILKRAEKDRKAPLRWNLPGGKFEKGETCFETASRELEEETGIKIDSLKFSLKESKYKEFIQKFNFQAYLMLIELEDIPEVLLNEEHCEFKWITINEIDDNNLLCYISKDLSKFWKE